MKKFLFLFLLIAVPVFAQTNYFWSANFTSNYIRNFFQTNAVQTNITEYVRSQLTNNNAAITGSVPFIMLSTGKTTNVAFIVDITGPGTGDTNWMVFTNGVLQRITNNVP